MIPVVLVDDSPEIRELLEELLSDLGPFQVVARLGTELDALSWLEQRQHWELAVLDLVLQDGSGFNLIRRFRTAQKRARLTVLSDFATPGIKVNCVQLGADAVFTKGEVKTFAAYVSRMTDTPQTFRSSL